ncbi:hypothetical protein [Mobilicoccus caccae]|uniref:ABC-2 type transport system permease protein n=1 Tax=Mobilicoccus caccae TaxID=1859295 RepID=A0ABQ6IX62_9MICO|nr:hypothetical protein [Mobilicoccus caccae]GMA41893.1 hypothetical protein GCM10025883_39380 [Mobilicoccus caccae]
MTTTALHPTPPAAASIGRLTGVELRKLIDTRPLIVALVAACLAAGATGGGSILSSGPAGFGDVTRMALLFVPYFLVGIGAALVTSENTHRTALTTFAIVPRRGRVLLAKAAAMGVLGVVAAVLALAAGTLICSVAPLLGLGPVSWEIDWSAFAVLTAGLVVSALVGWALGMATGSTAITLAVFLVFPMVATAVGSFAPAAAQVLGWLRPDTVYDLAGRIDAAVIGRTATGLLLWLVTPAVIGWMRLTRGEVR